MAHGYASLPDLSAARCPLTLTLPNGYGIMHVPDYGL